MFNYRREFDDDPTQVEVQFVNRPDTRFATTGLSPSRSTIQALGGLTMRTGSGLEYTLQYQFRRGSGELSQSVDFRVRFR
jgi:uncharacterized protein with beta-barrel porin domain